MELGRGTHGTVCVVSDSVVVKETPIWNRRESGAIYLSDGCLSEPVALERARAHGVRHVVKVVGREVCLDTCKLFLERLEPLENAPAKNAKKYVRDLFETVADMRAAGISHRDIKLENIMYRRQTDEAVLIDFGLAKVDYERKEFEPLAYTAEYRAPEVILRAPHTNGICYASDVWAAGVCAALLLRGFPSDPESFSCRSFNSAHSGWLKTLEFALDHIGAGLPEFPGCEDLPRWRKASKCLKRHEPPAAITEEFEFISGALVADPTKRSTADAILGAATRKVPEKEPGYSDSETVSRLCGCSAPCAKFLAAAVCDAKLVDMWDVKESGVDILVLRDEIEKVMKLEQLINALAI